MTIQTHTWQHCTGVDDPSLGQDFESGSMGSLDDFQLPCPGAPHNERRLVSGISAIGENTLDERKQSARPAQKTECSITVLNVGRMNNDVQQETQRIAGCAACDV